MKKVRFAVIGVGGFGRRHASAIKCSKRGELVAVCDVIQSRAMNWADTFGCTYYTDYKEMLEDGGFDAVTIAVQDQAHAEIAVAAMEAGYHVFCEKPLALNREDCKRIVEAQRKTGRCFSCGQSLRKAECFGSAREMIKSGELGEIFQAELEYSHNYSHLKPEWRRDPVNLRYPIIGGGCHAIDILRWTMGEDPTEVIAISNHIALKDWPVDDCTVALMKMPSGAIARVTNSIGIQRKYVMSAIYSGTKATLECMSKTNGMMLHKPKADFDISHEFDELYIPISFYEGHNVECEIEELCSAILDGTPISCDALEGAKTVAVGLAAVESARLGGLPVKPDYNF